MQKSIFICAIVGSLVLACTSTVGQNPESMMLKDAPSVSGEEYRCEQIVQVVNRLRHLGKGKALNILKKHLREGDSHDSNKVLLVCRLLFINPEGWKPLQLGEPIPAVRQDVAKQFAAFPIALSDRVPFLLLIGYRLGGRGESPLACVELCQKFELIPADLPSKGYDAAARTLINSSNFQKLYQNPKNRVEMAEIILRQTQAR